MQLFSDKIEESKMQPFSDKRKGIVVKELSDGLYYAFNFQNPSGVKILSERAAGRLESIAKYGLKMDTKNSIDLSLAKSGIFNNQITSSRKTNKFSVWIHVVNACNLSCRYCYIQNLRKAANSDVVRHMSTKREDVIQTVNNLLAY